MSLFLASCSSPQEASPEPSPAAPLESATESTPGHSEDAQESEELTAGTYRFESSFGGKGTIEIPGEGPAELVALAEESGEDVVFLSVDVDNREGTENINMYSVNIYDQEGNQYNFVRETDWMDTLPSPSVDDTEAYNARVELYNSFLDGAAPHQRKTVFMVGAEVPDSFEAVVVEPSGMLEEPVVATPVK